MKSNIVLLSLVSIGLAVSLLFSTLSYALRMMSRVVLEQQLIRRRRANALEAILSTRHELALTSSALRLLSNVTVVVAVCFYFLNRGDNRTSIYVFGYTLLVATPLLLITSVAIPQGWSKYAGESLIATSWPIIRVAHALLTPLTAVLSVFDEIVRRLAGVSLAEDDQEEAEQVEQEILAVVSEGTAGGMVDEDQKKMIEGIISFRDAQVGQIMTPRTDIIGIDAKAPLAELRDKILKDGLSRIPVYDGSLDNIVGVLYAKDLLKLIGTGADQGTASPNIPAGAVQSLSATLVVDLRQFMRPALFVPETKPLRDLLKEFRIQHVHMAIVLDEYGGTAGLVTTEDIVEEIVGDIADEYERPEPAEVRRIDERTVEVDARVNINVLNRELGLSLPEDQDYQTIGGLVISALGSIPAKGQSLTQDGLVITVLDSEPRRVKKLRLVLPEVANTKEPADAHAA